MRDNTPLAILWRRRWIVIATLLAFTVTTAVISKTLQRVYQAQATLLVVPSDNAASFDAAQAAQQVARTYGEIIGSRNVADLVAIKLADGTTGKQLVPNMAFEPIPETELLKITAEDPDPARAQRIANAYSDVFVAYADQNLAATTKATVSSAERATKPDAPARPKPTLYTLLAGIFGLAVGVALAFLRDRLDNRLHGAEEIEAMFGVPVLARIPRRGKGDISITAFAESFRVLRTNLQFASPDMPVRTIALTSARESEGKTTITAQLALASAEIDAHVLLVDADLIRPSLQKLIMPGHTEPLKPGLSNYLVGGASAEEAIHPTDLPNVDIVPTGPRPPSLAGLLESRRGRAAIADLAGEAELVLLDCPPLGVGADAAVLATRVDGVILVIDMETATQESVRTALRQLENVKARVLGLVLNRDRSAEPTSGYEYLAEQAGKRGDRAAARS